MRILISLIFLFFCFTIQAQTTTDSVITLDAVSVEAYQISSTIRSVPGSISYLTSREITDSDQTSLYNTLNTLPGLTMQSGTYTTNRIVIRGMGSRTPYNTNRIRFYLDDIPLTSSDGLSSPEETETENIGRIELIKGPSSALYGSGLGGSLNFFTPGVQENIRQLKVQYGSFNTWKLGFSNDYQNQKLDSRISLAHLRSDGWRQNSEYYRTSFLATNTFKGKNFSLNLLVQLTAVNSGIPSSVGLTLFEKNPQQAAANWYAIRGYKKYSRGLAALTLQNRFSYKITHKLIFFGRGTDSYEKRPFNNLDDVSLSAGLRNKLTIHLKNTEIVAGSELISEKYAWRLDTSRILINRNHENRQQVNIFTAGYYRPVRSLNISAAAALNYFFYKMTDKYAENGNQGGKRKFPLIFSPRLGINYSPVRQVAVFASAGHGFSMPSPEETLLPEGDVNRNIRHEQGWQFETGIRISLFNDRLQADATWYWIRLKDLLVTKRITEDIFTGVNAGRTNHMGFEIALNSRILTLNSFPGEVEALINYSGSVNRFENFTDNGVSYKGRDLPGIPSRVVYFQTTWKPVKMVGFIIDIRYSGRQFLNDANTLAYGSYYLINARIAVDLINRNKASFRLYTGVNNISNTGYASMLIVNAIGFGNSEPRYYYPGLPRNGYAGFSVSF